MFMYLFQSSFHIDKKIRFAIFIFYEFLQFRLSFVGLNLKNVTMDINALILYDNDNKPV